jgi:hypothetical protein
MLGLPDDSVRDGSCGQNKNCGYQQFKSIKFKELIWLATNDFLGSRCFISCCAVFCSANNYFGKGLKKAMDG